MLLFYMFLNSISILYCTRTGRIRTYDLQVMSLARCPLRYSANIRSRPGLNRRPFRCKRNVITTRPRDHNGDGRHRSYYLPHAKQTLYHLSYVPLFAKNIYISREWFEHPTNGLLFLHLQSVALPSELSRVIFIYECSWRDSNPRLPAHKTSTLTNWVTGATHI